MNKQWILSEDRFEAKTALAYEGLFTIGSGYLHARGSLEENIEGEPQNITDPRKPINNASALKPSIKKVKWGTFVPGVFGQHPFLNEELINLPYFLEIAPSIDGEKLDIEKSSIKAYERFLDMKSASLVRSLHWNTKSGKNVTVRFERFISGAIPSLCVQRLILSSDSEVSVTIKSGIDADVRTNGFDHFEDVNITQSGANEVKCIVKTNGGDTIVTHTQLSGPGAKWQYNEEHRRGYYLGNFSIPSKGQITIEKRTAVTTSRDLQTQNTEKILADTKSMSYEDLFSDHANFWANRWEKSDVVIEGDDDSQQALRCSIYHLLRCHVTNDPRIAIDAKGTAGDIYYGRFFWDTEVYILPFFLYTDPARAKTLVDFRIHTLKGAQENAAKYGYKGARYPWESDNYGRECCPVWQYADNEIHITADVVYAFAHYAHAIDLNYLTGPAAKVIVETARYWLDRIDWRPGDSYPSLLGVMGPDEYTPISNNNAYINFMVSFALSIASQVGQKAGATQEECRTFKEVADKLPIMRSKNNKLILQCEEFEKFAEPKFDELWKNRKAFFASQVTQERIYRSKCLKQADVLMLMFLFYDRFTEEEIRTAWDYYLPYTTHDSSLSAGVHAIMAIRLGLDEEAWKMFQHSKGSDLDVNHGGASEGIHIAGCGSNWQMIVFGIAGMRNALQAEILTLQPRLPKQWKSLTFPIVWKERALQITMEPNKTMIKNKSKIDLEVLVDNVKRIVGAGKEEIFLSK
jgi:trehalose/maltose hydrolase-like predicted phosphorylase